MDTAWKSAVLLIFGSLPILFAEHVEHRGFASSLSAAKEVCEELNETLVTVENDEKKKHIATFLQENKLYAAWLHAEFSTLRNWTFTDENKTILSESEVDVAHGGLCGAFASEGSSLFMSLPCTESLPALINKKACKYWCHKKKDSNLYKWHTLNKSELATPQKEYFGGFQFLKNIKDDIMLAPLHWIGLRKFQFSWPDGEEIPLNQWEDNSTATGDCLILKSDGNMAVVDCKSSYAHSVLCFTCGRLFFFKTISLVLGVVCGILLLTLIAAVCYGCRRRRTQHGESHIQAHGVGLDSIEPYYVTQFSSVQPTPATSEGTDAAGNTYQNVCEGAGNETSTYYNLPNRMEREANRDTYLDPRKDVEANTYLNLVTG